MEIKDIISLENLGTINKNRVYIGGLSLWFSYETIVAFSDENGFKCCESCFENDNGRISTTTGKFLNEIEPDKDKRLKRDDFIRELKICLDNHNLYNAREEMAKNLAE